MRARTTPALLGVAAIAAIAATGALSPAPAAGTEVKIFQTQNQAAFLAGTLEGVSVDSLGRLELAPRVERLASLNEPFLLSAAALPDGWVVGTGNAGKVLKIDRKGAVTELFAAPEPEVFAVWADPDGTVFAATSPRGKVYRIPAAGPKGGTAKAEVFFEHGETYVWALARAADGALLVATGTQGKLFKVDAKGRGEVLYDSDDAHLRSMAVLPGNGPGGDVLLGTAGEGLILRLGRDGQVRTLHDAAAPEIVALALGPDGTCYAAVAASEASLVDLSRPPAAPAPTTGPAAGATAPPAGQVTVTVDAGAGDIAAAASGSRRDGATGPRSEILSISPTGVVESLWSFASETVYDLLWGQGRLWVATGLEGKLYSYADRQMLLEKDVDERQVLALLPGEAGPAFGTTNAAAFYRVTSGIEKSGTYTSAALDAGQAARFGTFRWQGDVPRKGAVRLSFRSGMSAEPDRTWSPWTAAKEGEEVSLDGLPRGRYVQWRAELRSGDGNPSPESASPRLYGAELSYRQENLRPKIDGLVALDAGQILVPANFNPTNQVYEPASPNREGIFTTLRSSGDEEDRSRTKPLWKRGFRTLRWTASDPNGDQLLYSLSFRPVEGPQAEGKGEEGWLTVAEDLKDEYYSFDATVLPDGVYRFRLVATDRPSNEQESAQTADRVSDPVVVDHTPPVLEGTEKSGGRLRVRVKDAASPIREAVYSVDATEWKPVEAADGLLDGRAETLWIPLESNLPSGERKEPGGLLLLRVTDAAFNVTTFNLSSSSR